MQFWTARSHLSAKIHNRNESYRVINMPGLLLQESGHRDLRLWVLSEHAKLWRRRLQPLYEFESQSWRNYYGFIDRSTGR